MFRKFFLLFIAAVITLSACGTLEIAVERTPTPAPTVTRTPARTETPTAIATPALLSSDGGVSALAVQPDGKILMGGDFTTLGGERRTGIARLDPDGTLDTTFNPQVGADEVKVRVDALAMQLDGKILVGGAFFAPDEETFYNIARLNPDGTLDAAFNPVRAGCMCQSAAIVSTLVVQADGKIVVGGDFTELNGEPRKHIARLWSNGTLDTAFSPKMQRYASVDALAVQADGKIVVGGRFTNVGGVARDSIARLNLDGTLDPAFNPRAKGSVNVYVKNGFVDEEVVGSVWSLAVQPDGKIMVGGEFATLGGATRYCIARLNPDGTLDASFNLEAALTLDAAGPVSCFSALVLQADGKVVVRGELTLRGYKIPAIARLNPDGTLDAAFNLVEASGIRHMVAQPDGKVVVGGSFITPSGQMRYNIARLNPDGAPDTAFNPGASERITAWGRVEALAAQANGKIVVGGDFITLGGERRNFIARLNPDGTLDKAFDPGADGRVLRVLAVQPDGKILVGGGWFTTQGGEPLYNIARLNPDGTLDTSFNLEVDNGIVGLVVQPDGKLVVAWGSYKIPSGPYNMERLNPDGASDTTFNPELYGPVDALVVQPDGKIMVAVDITIPNGKPRSSIARLNPDGTLDAVVKLEVGGRVEALGVQPDGEIVVGGDFASVGGVARDSIARLNPDGTLDAAFNPGVDGWVEALAVQPDGKIVVAGWFYNLGGGARNSMARLNPDGTLDTTFNP